MLACCQSLRQLARLQPRCRWTTSCAVRGVTEAAAAAAAAATKMQQGHSREIWERQR